jgi:hypothetical protein
LQAYDIGQVVLSLASLFPGCFSKRYPNDVRINAQMAEMQGSFPIYENTIGVFPYASLLSIDEVNETRYAVIGVTNRMLATHPSLAHVTVDLGNAGQLHVKCGLHQMTNDPLRCGLGAGHVFALTSSHPLPPPPLHETLKVHLA